MAIFHLTVKPISRGKGRSAMGASAYHSASALKDLRLNLQHDYSKKQGVVKSDCFYFHDGEKIKLEREQLWNIAELSESASNARTAREIVVNIPYELNEQQRKNLIDEFAESLSKTMGVAIDYSIHLPSKDGDDRNHHAHIMITTRNVVHHENGFSLGEKTDIELSNKKLKSMGRLSTQDQIVNLRQDWELLANEHLFQAGKIATIDHRSHKDRGLDILPTVKLGPLATSIERNRSKNLTANTSKMGDFNREIATYNAKFIKFHNLQIIRAFMPRPAPPTPFDPPKPMPAPKPVAEVTKPKPPAPVPAVAPSRPAPKPIPPFVSLSDLMHLNMSMRVAYQPVEGYGKDQTKTGINTFLQCVQTLDSIESGNYKNPVQQGRYANFDGGAIVPKEILSVVPEQVIATRPLNDSEKLVLQNIENQLKSGDGVGLLKDIALLPVEQLAAKYPALGVDVAMLNVNDIRPRSNVAPPPPEPISIAEMLDHDQHQKFTEDMFKAFSRTFRSEESKQKFREDMAKDRPAPEPAIEPIADMTRAEIEPVKPPAETPTPAEIEKSTPGVAPRPRPRGP